MPIFRTPRLLSFALALGALALASACRKTLELDYDSVSPKLVVEGEVTNEEIKVRVSRTSDMDAPLSDAPVASAAVFVSGSDGYDEQLVLADDGFFRSPSGAVGSPGVEYFLRVVQADTVCSASSVMPTAVQLDSVRFSWMPIMSDVVIRTCYLYFIDPPEDSFYQVILSRDSVWIYEDRHDDTMLGFFRPNNFMMAIMSRNHSKRSEEKRANGEVVEDSARVLFHGDVLDFQLRSIPFSSYSYYRSMGLNTSSAINPSSNIVGDGCLGLFSAYYVSRLEWTYDADLPADEP